MNVPIKFEIFCYLNKYKHVKAMQFAIIKIDDIHLNFLNDKIENYRGI